MERKRHRTGVCHPHATGAISALCNRVLYVVHGAIARRGINPSLRLAKEGIW